MPHSSVFNFTKNNLTWLLPIAALPYLIIRAYHGGDFSVYMGAAELLADHKNCYNVWITYKGFNMVTARYLLCCWFRFIICLGAFRSSYCQWQTFLCCYAYSPFLYVGWTLTCHQKNIYGFGWYCFFPCALFSTILN